MSAIPKASRGTVLRAPRAGSLEPAPRATHPPPGLGRVLQRRVATSEQKARGVLQAAEAEARSIIADAKARAEEQFVVQRARARADALASVVTEAVALRTRRTELAKEASQQSVQLARILAERILGEELTLNPSRVQSLASKVLEEATGAPKAILHCNPEDVPRLDGALLAQAALIEHVELQPDPRLQPGNLRVETELGLIDGDIAGQLDYLAERLTHLLK